MFKLGKLLVLLQLLPFCLSAQGQELPYKVKAKTDIPITVGAIGLNVLGTYLILNEEKLTEADLAKLRKDQVNRFDRFAAGNFDPDAKQISDFPFYGSFVLPLALLFDKDVQDNAPQVYLLYAETMSITGAMFSLTAGLTKRKRPNVYATHAPLEERLHKYATNSLYSGHTAATASATFFAAKVFHDFNPDSPARVYVWVAAALLPATVGYLRLKAGKHFLSDNIIGYTLGAATGILVPELHKKQDQLGLYIHPVSGPYQGLALTYLIK
ncbi:MAG: phosphatase PAP2 family protein [Hymenobacteraceae bacterium]|nr:phosphatase PAP2 family protein [Hymenobacteraceae bacterium]MDX5395296.1 phosphatase PAP2 family protein [Hymenobacteraceae bacterium]MDX5442924.1 phosphatase PAP2 family protein [Hymenobacteraceae bacterium]MDX5511332.1 phosphatase PAP2 family protein [Hymenobacteraceae bacterium]